MSLLAFVQVDTTLLAGNHTISEYLRVLAHSPKIEFQLAGVHANPSGEVQELFIAQQRFRPAGRAPF